MTRSASQRNILLHCVLCWWVNVPLVSVSSETRPSAGYKDKSRPMPPVSNSRRPVSRVPFLPPTVTCWLTGNYVTYKLSGSGGSSVGRFRFARLTSDDWQTQWLLRFTEVQLVCHRACGECVCGAGVSVCVCGLTVCVCGLVTCVCVCVCVCVSVYVTVD